MKEPVKGGGRLPMGVAPAWLDRTSARYQAGQGPAAYVRDARSRYHPLAFVFAAVFAGAAVDRVCHPGWAAELLLAVALSALWLAAGRRSDAASLLLVLGMAASTAAVAHHVAWWQSSADTLHAGVDERLRPIVAELRIHQEPRWGESQSLTVRRGNRRWTWEASVLRLRDGSNWRHSSGAVELRMSLEHSQPPPSLPAGSVIRVFGEASRYPAPVNPGDWDPRQSRRTRRRCVVYARPDGVQRLKSGKTHPRRALHVIREAIHDCLRSRISRGQSGLAAALLLGRREQLTSRERERFINAGIAHLLALSGLHVGLLAGLAWGLGRAGRLSRGSSCGAAVGLALAYLMLAGPRPSLLRATVLIVALAWARWQGKPQAIWNSLAGAALLLAALDPSQLFDPGAQLSFLAVAALCCWGQRPRKQPDPLQRLIQESRPWWRRTAVVLWRGFCALLIVNLMVWLMTAPVTAWRFGRLAPIGILLNPIVGPLVAAALYATLAALAFAPLATLGFPGAEWACRTWGDLAGWLLELIVGIADRGANVPAGHFEVTPPPAIWAAAASALWLAWGSVKIYEAKSHGPPNMLARAALGLAAAAWIGWGAACQFPERNDRLEVTVLAVGHGSCVVVRTPNDQLWVFDAGRLGGGAPVQRALRQLLHRERFRKIDRLIISHEDVDHYNAAPWLLESGLVRRLVIGPRMLNGGARGELALLETAVRISKTPIERLAAGDGWSAGDVQVRVLHPPSQWDLGAADNADSLVVHLTYKGRSLLIAGDVEGPGFTQLLTQPITATVLLAPHHGSPHSFPLELAQHCRARWLIVSSGHERKELLDNGNCRVLQTVTDGAIQVRMDNHALTLRTWRGAPWSSDD